jgi:membrane-bound lytic murein transglycosylase B
VTRIVITLLLLFTVRLKPDTTYDTVETQAPTDSVSRPSFTEWLEGVRAEALARGIRAEIVQQALGGITEPLPIILERDRTQAEAVLSLEQYIARHLTAKFIRQGRQMAARHQPLLQQVAAKYGVPAPILVGIWGLESNFGQFSGVRPTIPALATLAWDPRRASFFRGELLDALMILNRGDIEPSKLRGSWAGAMGQPQFMPSSYLAFAEDFDGDGRRNIWSSPADVFASIANYLKGHGWAGDRWGREVKVSADAAAAIAREVEMRQGTCVAKRDMTVALPQARWQALGVRRLDGGDLPGSSSPDGGELAALVSGTTRRFLVSANYDALLEYNCAHSYALNVALFADRLAASP